MMQYEIIIMFTVGNNIKSSISSCFPLRAQAVRCSTKINDLISDNNALAKGVLRPLLDTPANGAKNK